MTRGLTLQEMPKGDLQAEMRPETKIRYMLSKNR